MIVKPRAQESLGRPKSSRIQLCRKPPRIILEQGATRNLGRAKGVGQQGPTAEERKDKELGVQKGRANKDSQARNPRFRNLERARPTGEEPKV